MVGPLELGIAGGLAVRQVRHVREYYEGVPGATTGVLAKDAGLRVTVGAVLLQAVDMLGLGPLLEGLRPALFEPNAWLLLVGAVVAFLANLGDETALKAAQRRVPALQKPVQRGSADVHNLLWWFQDHLESSFSEPPEDPVLARHAARARASAVEFVATFVTTEYEPMDQQRFNDLGEQARQAIAEARRIARGDAAGFEGFAREMADFHQRLVQVARRGAGGALERTLHVTHLDEWKPDEQAGRFLMAK